MKNRKVLGFTLIELLIVIAIIGILAVAFLPSLLNAPAKGRDAQRVATIQKLEGFLVTQMLGDLASLPAAPGCVDIDLIATADTISKLVNDNLAGFAGVFPADPDSTNITAGAGIECIGKYVYVRFTGGDYTAGVFINVENDESGNIECSNDKIKVDATPVLTDSGDCYIALLQ
jgi:prepilin-type N-terminal cleavage/methylation domain-containing protein